MSRGHKPGEVGAPQPRFAPSGGSRCPFLPPPPALCLWAWTHGCGQGPQGTPPVHCAGGRQTPDPPLSPKRGVCPLPDPRQRPATCPVAGRRSPAAAAAMRASQRASEPASPAPSRLGLRCRASLRPPASRPAAPLPRTCTCTRSPSPHPRSHRYPHLWPQRFLSLVPPLPGPARAAPTSKAHPSPLPGRGGAFPSRGRGPKGVGDLAAGDDSAPRRETKPGTYRSAPPGTPT